MNGRTVVLMFPHDVRVGDIIEYAYSIVGANQALRGKVEVRFDFESGKPLDRMSYRLLVDRHRHLHIEKHFLSTDTIVENEQQLSNGDTEYRVTLDRFRPPKPEPLVPPSTEVYSWVRATEFETWKDVVEWALPYYAVPDRLSETLQKQLDVWRSLPNKTEALRKAVGFVQNEIRYLGIEIGPSAFVPSPPDETAARRFGDCKDKALLLVTILRHLGIDAVPALVSTDLRSAVTEVGPSPFVFDHVVVRISIDGVSTYIDGTVTHQNDPFAVINRLTLGATLPLDSGVDALDRIPEPEGSIPTLSVRERYDIAKRTSSAFLQVTSEFRGPRARDFRGKLQQDGRQQLSEQYLDFYKRMFKDVRVDKPIEIADSDTEDLVTVREHYYIPNHFDAYFAEFTARPIRDALFVPESSERKLPLRIVHPVFITHTVDVVWDRQMYGDLAPKETVIQGAAIWYRRHIRHTAGSSRIVHEYETRRDEVAVSEYAAHKAVMEQIDDSLDFSFPSLEESTRAHAEVESKRMIFYAALVFLGLPLLLLFLTNRRNIVKNAHQKLRNWLFKRKFKTSRGSDPSSPIRVPSAAAALKSVANTRCACLGRPIMSGADKLVESRFMEKTVFICTLRCPDCNEKRTFYFEIA